MENEQNIKEEDFSRLNNCVNGNPRYYLPIFMAEEELARKAGAKLYRGEQWGAGWVFSSYNLQEELSILNG